MQGRRTAASTAASASVSKGSTLFIKNSSSSVFSTTALGSASYVFFSSASLTSGTSYTLCSGSSAATATAQTGSSQSRFAGGIQPGGAPGQMPGNGPMQPGQAPDQAGIISGVSGNRRSPASGAARAQAAAMLMRFCQSYQAV